LQEAREAIRKGVYPQLISSGSSGKIAHFELINTHV
jgi:hypothetical protein